MPRLLSLLIPNRTGLPDPSRTSPADATTAALANVTTATIWHSLTHLFAKLAFWTAISLPVLYLPLLIAGLETTTDLFVFLGLFTFHIVALLVGRTHLSGAYS